jgi:hypothetical protein
LLHDLDDDAVLEANAMVERAVARVAKSLPAPKGTTWNFDAREDLVNDVWAEDIVFRCAQRVSSDKRLAASIDTAVRNLVIDRLRQEDDLPIRERVRDVLLNGPFVSHEDAFGLEGFDPARRYQGSEDELRRVADREQLPLIYERPDAKKRSPFASRPDLERVLTRVLEFARLFVLLNTLAAVIKARLNRARSFVHLEWELERRDDDPYDERADARPMIDPRVMDVTDEIWDALPRKGKIAVGYVDLSGQDAAPKIGVKSRTTALKYLDDARAQIEKHLEDEHDSFRENVAAELLRRHRQHWTEPTDPSSEGKEDPTDG